MKGGRMSSKKGKNKKKITDFYVHLKFALLSLPALFRDGKFLKSFLFTFIIFGTVLNLLSSGFASLQIFHFADFWGKIKLVFDFFLAIFGVNRNFFDFLLLFLINFLQSILVALVFYILNFRRKNLSSEVQTTGIIASFFLLSSGCPTCGTTILTPIILAILGSSGLALVGTITNFVIFISFLLALYVFQKIGYEAYIILQDQQFQDKKKLKKQNGIEHESK